MRIYLRKLQAKLKSLMPDPPLNLQPSPELCCIQPHEDFLHGCGVVGRIVQDETLSIRLL